jgi:radical SAM family uncharacterized protein/radical SAM-linked protein
MSVTEVLESEILPRVEKPSRYLGNELNSVHKDKADVEVRLALVFPDLYDLGLGNLGIHILYACINELPWAWCERAYAPAIDMETELRSRDLPLFGLESRDPLIEFDGIGFTLQSELTYTNILNCIDLAGIPVRTVDRTDAHPLTFAGGPAVFNPEPIAPFMDFFVIGDGEDVVLEIARLFRKLKGRPRKAKLLALSMLEGVYVPALYPFDTLEDGRILPRVGAPKVVKRITRDLNTSTFPRKYILPFTQQVHDRVSLEVLRGCTQGCRFCQAGMTTRPVRERGVEEIDQLMEETLANTGYEEVSLVSLSTCDHSRVRKMVDTVVKRARADRVSVSLPSLRLDSFSVELADMVAETRRTGLTVAPEAASPRLRSVINKWIPDDDLIRMSEGAFKLGWKHVKLYFMIGLPTERDDDIAAIADLSDRTVQRGREFNRNAKVNLGVSTFVPKPFTPFQWAEQIDFDETVRRQDVLMRELRGKQGIKFGRHHPEETFLEGLVSRADRRAADLLELAWRKGCRFDAWREHLRFDLWKEAIAESGYDVADALRAREVDERLPWDHIDVMIPKQWFIDDWERALQLEHAQDCRHKRCHKCGVIDAERELCASMLRDHVDGRKEEADWKPSQRAPHVEAEPAQRLHFKIGRTGTARFLSHLEAMNAWIRALRRVRAPLAYSQGFHPHPKVAFSSATPMLHETEGDYLDITLIEKRDPETLRNALQATLPEGFFAYSASEVPLKSTALMAVAAGATYRITLPRDDADDVRTKVAALIEAPELIIERRKKLRKGRRREKVLAPLDIRPMIRELALVSDSPPTIELVMIHVDGKPGKAREIVPFLTDQPEYAVVRKRQTLVQNGDDHIGIDDSWGTIDVG